ncbi:UNVERIFIED_CONTAM: hypothetical protein PYX00_008306 [Menopon gallinae]|uniref:CREG-like beta-barrel domain-containing protein n=1 Tax=Menopon gallinae TaxID=328185 RepID=A0AAW2HMA3_9NEOP
MVLKLTVFFISILAGTNSQYSFSPSDLPDPKDTARMARYIVHISNWTAVSYLSTHPDTKYIPLSALFSVSDGPEKNGSGIPYFYVTPLEEAVSDMLTNNNCSILMSLAQTSICKKKNWDPEDPRCAHVILTGLFEPVNENSTEYPVATQALFSRHPSFSHLPANHNFFVAKLNIERILVQDMFGGPSLVPLSDYFNVTRETKVSDEVSDDNFTSGSSNLESKLLTLSVLGFIYSYITL